MHVLRVAGAHLPRLPGPRRGQAGAFKLRRPARGSAGTPRAHDGHNVAALASHLLAPPLAPSHSHPSLSPQSLLAAIASLPLQAQALFASLPLHPAVGKPTPCQRTVATTAHVLAAIAVLTGTPFAALPLGNPTPAVTTAGSPQPDTILLPFGSSPLAVHSASSTGRTQASVNGSEHIGAKTSRNMQPLRD